MKAPKPIHLVKGHRTKAEREIREKAEKALLTGHTFKEWDEVRGDPIAHVMFQKMKKWLKAIKHDDALHEATVNRYCLIHSECHKFEVLKDELFVQVRTLDEMNQSGNLNFLECIDRKSNLQNKIFSCDKKIMDKRKMLLDIEKESVMTIASALRSIPKKPEKKQGIDPMAAYLNRKRAGRDEN